jgi:Fe-S-cluster containining protein
LRTPLAATKTGGEEEMKRDVVREVCKKCGAACCKMGGTDFTRAEMQRVLNRGFHNYFVKIGRNHYELVCKKGICPYLKKDNTCAINEIKPLACRSWPLYLKGAAKGKTRYFLLECPLATSLQGRDIRAMKKQANHVQSIIKSAFSASKISSGDMRLVRKRLNKFPKSYLR